MPVFAAALSPPLNSRQKIDFGISRNILQKPVLKNLPINSHSKAMPKMRSNSGKRFI